MKKLLFECKKVCCVCDAEQTRNRGRMKLGEPSIVSLYLYIYRKGKGKGILKKTQKVYICESCLQKAASREPATRQLKLWHELRYTLLGTYKSLLEAENE